MNLPRCPDNGAAAGANIFDAAVDGFLTPALGGAFHRQAAGVDLVLTQGFSDPCLRLRGQRRYRPAVLGVFLNVQAMGLSGSLKFLVVVVAVVAYVLEAMNQIVEMRHLMQECGCQLEDGPVKVLGAEIDFPILLAAGVPYLIDTAPAIRAAPSIRGYGDRRAVQLALVKMLVEQVEHFLGFSYDFRYLQHDCVLLKDMFYFCE